MREGLLILLFTLSFPVYPQNGGDWEDDFRLWCDDEDISIASYEEVFDILSRYNEHPINLNQATREDLELLPFLTNQQIEEIISYLDRYGIFRSKGELLMLSTLDSRRRQLLLHFVYLGEPRQRDSNFQLDSLFVHGKHQLLLTGRVPLYNRKGDQNGYLGPKYRHSFRYLLDYHNRVKIGITGAQDAGEPFFSNKNKWGYDHYSYFMQIKDWGFIEQLNLGMYRIQMGMGLVMNSGLYFGKLSSLQSLGRTTTNIRPHSSRSAEGYLQGAAATFRLHKDWKITTFASFRYIDATLNDNGSLRTLLESNYHRTPKEMEKKNNAHKVDLGGSLGFHKGKFFAHSNINYTIFKTGLEPENKTALYRRYAAKGNNFLNLSLDYSYTDSHFSLIGETAMNEKGALATIHQLKFRFSNYLNTTIIHRYYDKKYTSFNSNSFREGTSIQNEHGIFWGLNWELPRKLSIYWYIDYTHFPFPRYQVSSSSDSFDTMLLTSIHLNSIWKLEGRYRLHLRQKDNDKKNYLLNQTEHRARMRLIGNLSNNISLRTQMDGVSIRFKDKNLGWMVSQEIAYKLHHLQLNGNFSYFHTDDYDSRLYLHEYPLLYEYASLMLYGKGIRYAVKIRADIGSKLMVVAKIGVTNYFDRSSIASGMEEIRASSMADIDFQLRLKF